MCAVCFVFYLLKVVCLRAVDFWHIIPKGFGRYLLLRLSPQTVSLQSGLKQPFISQHHGKCCPYCILPARRYLFQGTCVCLYVEPRGQPCESEHHPFQTAPPAGLEQEVLSESCCPPGSRDSPVPVSLVLGSQVHSITQRLFVCLFV